MGMHRNPNFYIKFEKFFLMFAFIIIMFVKFTINVEKFLLNPIFIIIILMKNKKF